MARRVSKKLLWVVAALLLVSALLAFGWLRGWWAALTGDAALDRGDKIASIVSGFAAVAGLALGVAQALRASAGREQPAGMVSSGWQLSRFFVDRDDETRQLRRALSDKATRIVVVHGPPGIGKTELVHQVLGKVRIKADWHLATPTFTPTSDTLLHDLAVSVTSRQNPMESGEAPNGRLEAALQDRGTGRHVIVIDAVERLLNADFQLTDLSLDEALELISTGDRHRVTVVLIGQVVPAAAASGTWARTSRHICLQHLSLDHFRTFVTKSAEGRAGLLASLDNRRLAEVHRALGGRPRLAQLFDEVVEQEDHTSAVTLAGDVVDWADRVNSIDIVGDRLRQRMTDAFAPQRRCVFRAVAAFATPVDPETVTALVNEGLEPDQRLRVETVRQELTELNRHAISADRDLRTFFLTPDEAQLVLNWRRESDPKHRPRARKYLSLLDEAGEILRRRRQADREGRWANPQASLAEVDVWLRGDKPDGALRAIQELDSHAVAGRPAMLFRLPRQRIADRIDLDRRPANYAVLGYLYHASGDLPGAKNAYGAALAGIPDDNPLWKAKILINRAGLEWAMEALTHALRSFERARDLAPQDAAVQAGALTGMARCERRGGRFTKATQLLNEALRMAGTDPISMIPIAVRLLRLHIEQGRLHEAEKLLQHIREKAEQAGDASLTAIYQDALADLRLTQGRQPEAMRAARKAVRLALPVHDPVTALQARSTMCAIQLQRKDFDRAAREATLARRYSGNGSLIVMALQGVACRRAGRLDEAEQAFRELDHQATIRTRRYRRDFTAQLFRGIGLCAHALADPAQPVDEAFAAFQQARRRPVEPAPTITRQMLFLLETIAINDIEHRRLRPVTSDLQQALAQQETTNATKATF